MTTAATADVPARHILASDPLLRWDAIAAHARDHHGVTWPTDRAVIRAIVGAFDAIVPVDCGYSPVEGTISCAKLPPAAWVPAWTDAEGLNCTIAVLAANAADCDLQAIFDEVNLATPRRPRPPDLLQSRVVRIGAGQCGRSFCMATQAAPKAQSAPRPPRGRFRARRERGKGHQLVDRLSLLMDDK